MTQNETDQLIEWLRDRGDKLCSDAADEIASLRHDLEAIVERVKNDPDVRGYELADIASAALD